VRIRADTASGYGGCLHLHHRGAAPNILQTVSDFNGNPISITATAGNKLMIGIVDAGTAPAVTCGTKSAVLIGLLADVGYSRSLALMYIDSADGGAQTCTLTTGTGNHEYTISEVNGASSGIDGSSVNTNGCSAITTTGTNRLGFAAIGQVGGTPVANGNSVTDYVGHDFSTAHDPTWTTAGSHTLSMPTGEYPIGCVSVALKPAGGSASVTPPSSNLQVLMARRAYRPSQPTVPHWGTFPLTAATSSTYLGPPVFR